MPKVVKIFGKSIPKDESLAHQMASGVTVTVTKTSAQSEENQGVPLMDRFEPRKPRRSFQNLILSKDVRKQIDVLLSRIRNHDLLYNQWGLAKIDPYGQNKCVNFFGPPGTGKTMCAEALADALGKDLIEVNYAEIESKYVGETPKNITAAFKAAETKDALLFFDEADSILGRRMTNITQSADQAVNVSRATMLKQLDNYAGVVVFATNLARNFDGAFVRRILMHIEVPLPDEEGRDALWRLMLMPSMPGAAALDFAGLTKMSVGFSGGDIKNAVVTAAAMAADRSGDEKRLRQSDILEAMEALSRAKTEIGGSDDRNATIPVLKIEKEETSQ